LIAETCLSSRRSRALTLGDGFARVACCWRRVVLLC